MFNYRKFAIALFILGSFVISLLISASLFLNNYRGSEKKIGGGTAIEIGKGDGVKEIAQILHDARVIESQPLFKLYVFLSGNAHRLKPGLYEFDLPVSVREVVRGLVAGPSREIEVTIPEGSNLWEIDELLARAGVLPEGSFVAYTNSAKEKLEGYLFPDTYRFFRESSPEDVALIMRENFDRKALSVLGEGSAAHETLIMASMLEKEVPDYEERRIVAGILQKRLKVGMGLQVDATICYIKFKEASKIGAKSPESCYPLAALDFKIDSPYNTYLHRGLPPAPIGNPGLDAIRAAKEPVRTEYWYYLSDPKTKKTIFSETLDEHRENRVKYLSK